jgi:hypothetical protein
MPLARPSGSATGLPVPSSPRNLGHRPGCRSSRAFPPHAPGPPEHVGHTVAGNRIGYIFASTPRQRSGAREDPSAGVLSIKRADTLVAAAALVLTRIAAPGARNVCETPSWPSRRADHDLGAGLDELLTARTGAASSLLPSLIRGHGCEQASSQASGPNPLLRHGSCGHERAALEREGGPP